MTDILLPDELRSQFVMSACRKRKEYRESLDIEFAARGKLKSKFEDEAKFGATPEDRHKARQKLKGFQNQWQDINGVTDTQFYKKLAKEIGIDSYARYFGNLGMLETWKRLCHYKGVLPPPESIERTVRSANLPKSSPHIALKKSTQVEEYRPDSDKAQINVVTDITSKSILLLPILPINSLNFLPAISGLFFVMASAIESKVIYVGKTQNLKNSWQGVYTRHKSPIASHRRREMTVLASLGSDLYIRWIPLPASNEPSLWQAHAIKVLQPFFMGREIEDETTLHWEVPVARHWQRNN